MSYTPPDGSSVVIAFGQTPYTPPNGGGFVISLGGTGAITAAITAQDGADEITFAATSTIHADMATGDGADTVSSSLDNNLTGAIVAQDGAELFIAYADPAIGADGLAIDGYLAGGIASVAIEALGGDTDGEEEQSAVVSVRIGASVVVADSADTFEASAESVIVVHGSLIESADGVELLGGVAISGSIEAQDLLDQFEAALYVVPIENVGIQIKTSLVTRLNLASGVNSDVTIGSALAYRVSIAHEGIPVVETGSMLANRITLGILPAPR